MSIGRQTGSPMIPVSSPPSPVELASASLAEEPSCAVVSPGIPVDASPASPVDPASPTSDEPELPDSPSVPDPSDESEPGPASVEDVEGSRSEESTSELQSRE